MLPIQVKASSDTGWAKHGYYWYYITQGRTLYGWQKINGNWYYLGQSNDGSMKSGWQKINSSWYYLGQSNDGSMKSGWHNINGSWYYLGESNDGAMKSGWRNINGSWYYLGQSNDGSMKSGWRNINGSWYYLGESNDGSMKSGWQKINGGWYYLGESNDGAMKSGWQSINGLWYYFGNADDGRMKEKCWIGQYYVGENGAWIPDYSETKEVIKATMSSIGSSMYDTTDIETEQSESIRQISDFVRGLQETQVEEAEPLMGGGYSIRLDFAGGNYQYYGFFYEDQDGNPLVLSNGKYYLYNEDDLHRLWVSLDGTLPEGVTIETEDDMGH